MPRANRRKRLALTSRSLHLGAGLTYKADESSSQFSNPRTFSKTYRLARYQILANPQGNCPS